MTPQELNFAYKVRSALNENLDNLPASTAERLALARKSALTRKKKDSPLRRLAARGVFAGQVGNFFDQPLPWVGRMGILLPIIVLVAGLMGIYQCAQQERIREIAEIDALVLSDELPLNAYLDHGFNAYLSKRAE
ncbi:MAG: DUF3619 family protein [Pseudomonadota bacterium]